MKITDIISSRKPSLSFEVFPPKTWDNLDSVRSTTEKIAALRPDFMSVTCGAAGSNAMYTLEIAENLQRRFGVTPIAHMTCVSARRAEISRRLDELQAADIENILALRGDIPEESQNEKRDFEHASDLVSAIAEHGGFCIGGACYPEGHIESANSRVDIENLKIKVDAGCSFLTTQMFFDNNILYSYLYKLREAGIYVPVIPGVMPVTAAGQIKRICALSGTQLPQRFRRILDRFGEDADAMCEAGIAYATDQIIDLFANGLNAVHVYSMNKPHVAARIKENLSHIISSEY